MNEMAQYPAAFQTTVSAKTPFNTSTMYTNTRHTHCSSQPWMYDDTIRTVIHLFWNLSLLSAICSLIQLYIILENPSTIFFTV